jgi:hypothetical protein
MRSFLQWRYVRQENVLGVVTNGLSIGHSWSQGNDGETPPREWGKDFHKSVLDSGRAWSPRSVGKGILYFRA